MESCLIQEEEATETFHDHLLRFRPVLWSEEILSHSWLSTRVHGLYLQVFRVIIVRKLQHVGNCWSHTNRMVYSGKKDRETESAPVGQCFCDLILGPQRLSTLPKCDCHDVNKGSPSRESAERPCQQCCDSTIPLPQPSFQNSSVPPLLSAIVLYV